MERISEAKSTRLLTIYARLLSGQVLNKRALALEFNVTERSIQRDMDSLRCFLSDQGLAQNVLYDRGKYGYYLTDILPRGLSNSEILAVCKILLESRSMRKDEMFPILDKLIDCCVPKSNRALVLNLLSNEKHHYIEPHHGVSVLDWLWEIGQAVQQHRVMEIEYQKLNAREWVHRVIEPVGILFSEYYFYLAAYIRNIDRKESFENPADNFPTIYRIDRIRSLCVTDERFSPAYSGRFQEGEFRKRVQFMYGGKLQTVRFTYSGPSIEAVLDRLPTAKVVDEQEGVYTVQAEVFGKGIDMWLRSQGEFVRTINQIN
ncbi:MAG: WYL domain-containing protein [Butyricicoccus sp.]|nr:WYL domain-containing protein [Butyricicoccus sp.]